MMKRNEFVVHGSIYVPFRIDLFQQGDKQNFDRVGPFRSVFIAFTVSLKHRAMYFTATISYTSYIMTKSIIDIY